MAGKQSESCWQSELLQELVETCRSDLYWGPRLALLNRQPLLFSIHLAVFVQPYLRFILEGRKTVESRFSRMMCAPYNRVKSGDIVLLKESGGPIVGLCQINSVWFYQLDPTSWQEIRDRFANALCVQDASFWQDREAALFATLMRMEHVTSIKPIHCSKRDRRGWVVLNPIAKQLELEALNL